MGDYAYHILICCYQAVHLWSLMFPLFGVSWVFVSAVKEVLLGLHDRIVGKRRKAIWKMALLCLFSTIRKYRNRGTFDSMELHIFLKLQACLALFAKIVLKNQFLRVALKSSSQYFPKDKILFWNSTMKNNFLCPFFDKTLCTCIQCKSSHPILYFFNCFLKHSLKNTWKYLKFVLKNQPVFRTNF